MRIQLVVVEGKPLGAVVNVKVAPFFIGREAGCHLRPRDPGVADRQCALFLRGSQVLVRDLGSAQGTLVNDRCLRRGDQTRVSDGDRLQVGPLIFEIRVEADDRGSGDRGAIEDCLLTPTPSMSGYFPSLSGSSIIPVPVDLAMAGVAKPAGPANGLSAAFAAQSFDEARGISFVRLSPAQLGEEADLRALRLSLHDLAGRMWPGRLVVDLSGIDELPSMCAATLLGLSRRCEAAGGELRLCCAPPPVRKVLDALRFGAIMACYDDPEEAIADSWARR